MTFRPTLVPTEPDIEAALDALVADNSAQTTAAQYDLHRPASDYLRFPFRALDELVLGCVPGDIGYVCAFSGSGKTTLLINLTDQLVRSGKRVYFMGLESRPETLRTKLACLRLEMFDGEVLTGVTRHHYGWPEERKRLVFELERQAKDDAIVFDGQVAIGEAGFRKACMMAADYGADVLVVDHIDHVSLGDSGSMWEESVRVNRLALEMAQRYDLRMLIASQCNNEAVRGDPIGQFQPPLPHHVKMGNHKREVAAYMLGLYRPIRSDIGREEMANARRQNEPVTDLLQPNTMGVVCMKHRYYGAHEGRRSALHVERGKVSDI